MQKSIFMERKYSVINLDGRVTSVLENEALFKSMFQQIVGFSFEELDELEAGYLSNDNFIKFTGIIETILVEQKCPSEQVSSTAKFIVCAYLYLSSSIMYENHEMRCQYYVYSVFMGLRNFGNCNVYFSRLVLTSVVNTFIEHEKSSVITESLLKVYEIIVTALYQHHLTKNWKIVSDENNTPLPLHDKVVFMDGHDLVMQKESLKEALGRLTNRHFKSVMASAISEVKSKIPIEDLDDEATVELELLESRNRKYFGKNASKKDAKEKFLENKKSLSQFIKANIRNNNVENNSKISKLDKSKLPEPTTFSQLLIDPEVLNPIRRALAKMELTNPNGEIIKKGCSAQIIIYQFCNKNKLLKNHIGLREKFAKLISIEFKASVTGRTLDNVISPNKAAKDETAKLEALLTEELLAHQSTN